MSLPDPIAHLKATDTPAFTVISWTCPRCGSRQSHNAGCKWVLLNGRKVRICETCAAERKDAPRIRKESPAKIQPWYCASCKTKQMTNEGSRWIVKQGKKLKFCDTCAREQDARGI